MVFRDVSERRAVERMKDEFTSVVSHELRTPLTSIRGSLGLLAAGVLGPLSDKAQHMVDIAVANTDRLVRLINDILDIERMESGTAVTEKRTCDAADLAGQAVAVMQGLAEGAGVTLVATTVAAPLWADPDRILQTLTNLLGNAIKFSPPGGTIGLDVERRGDEVLICVRDEGRGIPPEKIETVFGRFQQVDASDARQKGGTGLGLAICRGIVEQHGGRIWAESVPGEGSTFRISLPALAETPAPLPEADGLPPLVLVCDDDLDTLETVAEILEARGFGVIGVTTGEEAVEQAATQAPVAILLDLLMPGMSGWETAAALKERPETRDIPVVIMSGLSPLVGEIGKADAVDWLTKPVDADALFRGLERARHAPGGQRVLVVEDDPDLARVLLATLASRGLEAHHAASAREAIAMSESLVPDVVVLDLGLPDLDGLALVDWLRRHGHLGRVPIAVYTGRSLTEDERASLRSGGTEVLIKSLVSPERLVERVLELVGRLTEPEEGGDGA
jgi:CheY-like chemotaxis protein